MAEYEDSEFYDEFEDETFGFDGRPYLFESSGNWWCTCGCCEAMPTDVECFCCKEWDLLQDHTPDARCVTLDEGFSSLQHLWVLEAFFHVPKVNGTRRPIPEGQDGHLSHE